MEKVRRKSNRAKSKGSPEGGRVVNSLNKQSIGKIGEAFGQGNKIDGKLSETIRAESITELATLNMNYY